MNEFRFDWAIDEIYDLFLPSAEETKAAAFSGTSGVGSTTPGKAKPTTNPPLPRRSPSADGSLWRRSPPELRDFLSNRKSLRLTNRISIIWKFSVGMNSVLIERLMRFPICDIRFFLQNFVRILLIRLVNRWPANSSKIENRYVLQIEY